MFKFLLPLLLASSQANAAYTGQLRGISVITSSITADGSITSSSATVTGTAFSVGSTALKVQDGKVGISTASPAAVLGVTGGIIATSSITAQGGFYGAITGNATTATTATHLAAGTANQIPYQSAPGATTFVSAPGANSVLFANSGAPTWTNTPTLTGTNITSIPAASINTGTLGAGVVASSIAINTVYDGSVSGTLSWGKISKTGSDLSEIATRSHTVLSDIGTNNHGAIDTHISSFTAHNATHINTASRIVARDASGNFSAGTITAAVAGNATTATTATNFSGSLAGDVTGTQGATVVGDDTHRHGFTTVDISTVTARIEAVAASTSNIVFAQWADNACVNGQVPVLSGGVWVCGDATGGGGGKEYYFSSDASDVTPYRVMYSSYQSQTVTEYTATNNGADVLVSTFITQPGYPTTRTLPDFQWVTYLVARRVSGTRSISLYTEVYARSAGGVERIIGITGLSPTLTAATANYTVNFTTGVVILAAGERIVTKVKAASTAGAGATVIGLSIQGSAGSHQMLPTQALDPNLFITTGAAFGGDVSGTYQNLQVTDNSHAHNFTTVNIATVTARVEAVQSNLDSHTIATSTHGATSANTADRIVLRDGSGNFSAGTITATRFIGIGDSLGNHVATTTLQMGSYGVNTSSAVTAAAFQILGRDFVRPIGGASNIVIGVTTGTLNTNTTGNIYVGSDSLGVADSTHSYNTVIGHQSGSSLRGVGNSLYGYSSGRSMRYAASNAAIGASSLLSFNDGQGNTAVGALAADDLGSGSFNTALGYNSCGVITPWGPAYHNTCVGSGAGMGMRMLSSSNVFVGGDAGIFFRGGYDNVFLGVAAGASITASTNTILIGAKVAASSTSTNDFLNIGDAIYGPMKVNSTMTFITAVSAPKFYGSGNGLTDIPWSSVAKTGSNLSDIVTRSHTVLTDIGTNSHSTIDTHISSVTAHNATHLNTASRMVARDASGNFSAGTITAYLAGNAATATTATNSLSASSITWANVRDKAGSLSYDLHVTTYVYNTLVSSGIIAGIYQNYGSCFQAGLPAGASCGPNENTPFLRIPEVFPAPPANAESGVDILGAAYAGTSYNSLDPAYKPWLYIRGFDTYLGKVSTGAWHEVITRLNGGAINGSISGNAGTATALAADPSDCTSPQFALGINASGAAVCATLPITSTASLVSQIAGVQSKLDTHTVETSTHGATSANTASRIVMRDGSGNFTSGTITATKFIGEMDNLGNHVATTTLRMGAYSVTSSSHISAAAYQVNGSTVIAAFTSNLVVGLSTGTLHPASFGNTYVGNNSLQLPYEHMQANTMVGYLAGSTADSDHNTLVGYAAGLAVTGGFGNSALGSSALGSMTGATSTRNTAMGYAAGGGLTSGTGNSVFGAQACSSPSASYGNTCIGYQAGSSISLASSSNVFVGAEAAYLTGGRNNVIIGARAGYNILGATNTILIGYNVAASSTSTLDFLNIGDAIYGPMKVNSTMTFITAVSAPKFYGDGSALTGISSPGGVTTSTFTVALHSGGDIYVSSAAEATNNPFPNIGMNYVFDHATATITGVRCYTLVTSTVGSSFFNIAVSTATGNTKTFNFLFTTDIEVSTNTTYSNWAVPNGSVAIGALAYVPAAIGVHVTKIPTAVTQPQEYGCLVRYWRRLD